MTASISLGDDATNLLFVGGSFTFSGSTILLNGTAIGTRTSNGSGTSDLVVTFNENATLAIVEQLLHSVAFKTIGATSSFDRTVAVVLTDGQGGTSNTISRVVHVTSPPIAVADSYTIDEDGVLTITTAAGLLANDSDPNGGTRSIYSHTDPTHGGLSLQNDGSFTYTPNANFHGGDSFSYRLIDDEGYLSALVLVTITVTAVNDAPQTTIDSYDAVEDSTLTISAGGVLNNDEDVDCDVLTAIIESQPANGSVNLNSDGTFTYTPAANYHGPDSFTYRASDGTVQSNPVTVNLNVRRGTGGVPYTISISNLTAVEETGASATVSIVPTPPVGETVRVFVQPEATGVGAGFAKGGTTSANGADFNNSQIELLFDAVHTSRQAFVPLFDETTFEGNESFRLRVTLDSGTPASGVTTNSLFTINDAEGVGTEIGTITGTTSPLRIFISDNRAVEEGGDLVLRFRSEPEPLPDDAFMIHVSVVHTLGLQVGLAATVGDANDVTYISGAYLRVGPNPDPSGTSGWGISPWPGEFRVHAVDDTENEPSETFNLSVVGFLGNYGYSPYATNNFPINPSVRFTYDTTAVIAASDPTTPLNRAPVAGTPGVIRRWAESPNATQIPVWELFSDYETPDAQLSYSYSASGVVSGLSFTPSSGMLLASYCAGSPDNGSITVTATDPQGLSASVTIHAMSIAVTGFDWQLWDENVNSWITANVDEGHLIGERFRWRAHFTPIPTSDVTAISWLSKSWADAANDVTIADHLAGWTTHATGSVADAWYEWDLNSVGDYAVTPRIQFLTDYSAPGDPTPPVAQMVPPEKIGMYTITSVKWVGHNYGAGKPNNGFETGGNPSGMGGGDRFFPESVNPPGRAGSYTTNIVDFEVSLDRQVTQFGGLVVGLIICDPDHYSSDLTFDTNDVGGAKVSGDNVSGVLGSALSQSPNLMTGAGAAHGTIKVPYLEHNTLAFMDVTKRQPTNNYRAAAFRPSLDTDLMAPSDTDGATIKHIIAGQLPQTETLSIWRTLHLEIDSMAGPNWGVDNASQYLTGGTGTRVALNTFDTTTALPALYTSGQFQGGTIEFETEPGVWAQFHVEDSLNVGFTTRITVAEDIPVGVTKFRNLRDDDRRFTSADLVPDTSLYADAMADAMIEVSSDRFLAENPNMDTWEFDLEFEANAPEVVTGQDSINEPDFWSVHIIGAFQGAVEKDNDPFTEGSSSLGSAQGSQIMIYRETIRDFTQEHLDLPYPGSSNFFIRQDAEMKQAIPLHELGNQFMRDNSAYGAIMNYEMTCTANFNELKHFSGQGLRKIIEKNRPEHVGLE